MLRNLGVVFSGSKPLENEIVYTYGRNAILIHREYVGDGDPTEDGTPKYIYDVYEIETEKDPRYEKMSAKDFGDLVKKLCYDKAASEVRKVRNEMLTESDQYMTLDRGLKFEKLRDGDVTATNMLMIFIDLVRGLRSILYGDLARYRQSLRDLPEQDGFPYNIEYPKKPKDMD